MRIGDATFYLRYLTGLDLYKQRTGEALEGLADGKKVRVGSDDPAGAEVAMALRARLAQLAGLERSAESARSDLASIDNALGQVVNVLTEVRTEALAGGTEPLGGNDARAELIDSLRDQLLALANTFQGGRYLFGGTETLTSPFAADGSYAGNDDQVQAPIATGEQVGSTLSGRRVFLDGGDLFTMLGDLAQAMREDRPSDVAAMIPALGQAIDHMGEVRADVGARIRRVDNALDRQGDELVRVTERISEIENIDLARVIVDLRAAETGSSALSAAAARVLGRSLFDYLG